MVDAQDRSCIVISQGRVAYTYRTWYDEAGIREQLWRYIGKIMREE